MGTTKKTIKCSVSLLAVAGLIAGCATAAQLQYQTMTTNIQSATQKLQVCVQTEYYSAEFEPLRKHISIDIRKTTLEQLADTSLASEEEIKAIFAAHPKLQNCRQDFLNEVSPTASTLATIFANTMTKSENSLVDLIQKKQNW